MSCDWFPVRVSLLLINEGVDLFLKCLERFVPEGEIPPLALHEAQLPVNGVSEQGEFVVREFHWFV